MPVRGNLRYKNTIHALAEISEHKFTHSIDISFKFVQTIK